MMMSEESLLLIYQQISAADTAKFNKIAGGLYHVKYC